jgi:hypothetical protein
MSMVTIAHNRTNPYGHPKPNRISIINILKDPYLARVSPLIGFYLSSETQVKIPQMEESVFVLNG